MTGNSSALATADAFEGTVELTADTAPTDALALAKGASRVMIHFPTFKDGRGFSLASILRQKGFEGELVAAGEILPDQGRLARRCGFDHIHSVVTPNSPRWEKQDAGRSYQRAAGDGGLEPAHRSRAFAARKELVRTLNEAYRDAAPEEILRAGLEHFAGRVAYLSSFGAEAAVGLSLLAKINPSVPVLFLDTDRHFGQTLSYKKALTLKLGLENVIELTPDEDEAARDDPAGRLYETNPSGCCALRKVRPLGRGLAAYDAVVSGRKRHEGGMRAQLTPFAFDGERVQINPLVNLSAKDVKDMFAAEQLPHHPLTEQGYSSIGCWPCTVPSSGDKRDGRWQGTDKTECGIFDGKALSDAQAPQVASDRHQVLWSVRGEV